MELSPQQDVYYIDTVSPTDYFIDTVTPSAIQLNKEKIMSIELDGPLYLGSNSLQQQVDQNTEDITELQSDVSSIEGDIGSLDNLATSDKSSLVNAINETLSVLDPTQTADYIKNSKGLESGEISTNASILPWVEEMSHSTFDLSKFTVVGSPNITDNGIFTGASNTAINATCNANVGNTIIIEFPFTYHKRSGVNYPVILQFLDESNTVLLSLNMNENENKLTFGGDSKQLTPEQTYKIRLETDLQTYRKLIVDNVLISNVEITNTLNNLAIIRIGSNQTNAQYQFTIGSIDLKQFSITVDGVEVFSGNKTGIDTIKPDDYTVVGTPTISADGVASGFSGSDYITAKNNITIGQNDDFVILSPIFEFPSLPTVSTSRYTVLSLYGSSDNNISLQCRLETGGWVTIWKDNSGNDIIRNTTTISINTKYQFKAVRQSGTYSCYLRSIGSVWIQLGNSVTNKDFYSTFVCKLGAGLSSNTNAMSVGTLDLNALHFDINNSLIWQPCLKIPFTISKTGAKIVDSIYRDRVADMYSQFGYAPYYTLDTTNSNYTIPKGEVYGMVNKLVPTLVAPDYSKPVSLTYSSGLVMENDGWLEVQIQSSEATANPYVSINGSIICRTSVNSNGDLNRDTAMMVVRKGDIITSGGYSADTAIVLTYYPFKV